MLHIMFVLRKKKIFGTPVLRRDIINDITHGHVAYLHMSAIN